MRKTLSICIKVWVCGYVGVRVWRGDRYVCHSWTFFLLKGVYMVTREIVTGCVNANYSKGTRL